MGEDYGISISEGVRAIKLPFSGGWETKILKVEGKDFKWWVGNENTFALFWHWTMQVENIKHKYRAGTGDGPAGHWLIDSIFTPK